MLSRENLVQLPGVKLLHATGLLKPLTERKIGPWRGRFRTSVEAQASLPETRTSTYDNDAVVSVGIDSYSRIQDFDWPILFHLQKMMRENCLQSVTDFGGHIGTKFYAFREPLGLPASFRWQVVEVPAMVREGRRRADPADTSLSFFERIEDAQASEALICSGVLQYTDWSIEELVVKMTVRPQTILLNKLPISPKGTGFVTLENFGVASLPYRIFTENEVQQAREALGYRLIANWTNPDRGFAVISSKGMEWINMHGQAWAI